MKRYNPLILNDIINTPNDEIHDEAIGLYKETVDLRLLLSESLLGRTCTIEHPCKELICGSDECIKARLKNMKESTK